jgi:spermidine synthase
VTDSCPTHAGSSDPAENFAEPKAVEIEEFLDHLDGINREQRWSARFEAAGSRFDCDEAGFSAPLVFRLGDIKSLLASWAYVQSAMSIADPYRLVLEYTQVMMGFLLFNPAPRTVEIIGLGGGSLAKYCHRFLPNASIRGVEVDWNVIDVADQFRMPPPSGCFEIIWADGADFVATDERSTDILLVDGFDSRGQPPQLCTLEFYRACRSRLNADGILVVNLCNHHGKNEPILRRLRECFGTIISVPVEVGMNLIVFAFRDDRNTPDRKHLREMAKILQREHPLPMADLVEKLLW